MAGGSAGIGLLILLLACVTLWAGYNGLSARVVIESALYDRPLPAYSKGAGLRLVLAEFLGFELTKAVLTSAAGFVKGIVPGTAGGGGGESGGGGSGGAASESGGGGSGGLGGIADQIAQDAAAAAEAASYQTGPAPSFQGQTA